MPLPFARRCLVALLLACGTAVAAEPVLVIHGGAGVERAGLDAAAQAAARAALSRALRDGQTELTRSASGPSQWPMPRSAGTVSLSGLSPSVSFGVRFNVA